MNTEIRTTTRRRVSAIGIGFALGASALAVAGSSTTSVSAIDLSPSGPSVPTDDLDGWRHVFADDFATNVPTGEFPAKVSKDWDAYPSPWKDTSKKGTYSPKKVVSINNGVMTKFLRTQNGTPLVAAVTPKVTPNSPYGMKYGRFSIRMKTDRFSGYKMAYMLWPDVGGVTTGAIGGGGNGEIDYPESDFDRDYVFAFIHRQGATQGSDQAYVKEYTDITQWHTYTMEWSPDLVVIYLDGVETGRTTERIPNTAMHWVLQAETSLNKPTLAGDKGRVYIDWVSAWAYDPSAEGPIDDVAPTTTAPPATTTPATTAPAGSWGSGITKKTWVSWPADGRTITTGTPLKFDGDMTGIVAVKWYVDGQEVAYDGKGPVYEDWWESETVANGTHTIFAKARYGDGTWVTTRMRTFFVSN